MTTYSLKEFAMIAGVSQPAISMNEKYQKYITRKDGFVFVSQSNIKKFIDDEQTIEAIREKTKLFVEYLNKIEKVTYTEISKKINLSDQSVISLMFGTEHCYKIIKAYEHFLEDFDWYYGFNTKQSLKYLINLKDLK